jgi:hypothetical protein
MRINVFWDMTLCRLVVSSDVSKIREGSIDDHEKNMSVYLVTENISFLQSVILSLVVMTGYSEGKAFYMPCSLQGY